MNTDRDNIHARIAELEGKSTLTPGEYLELWDLQEEADRADEAEERERMDLEWEAKRLKEYNRT